MSGEFCLMRGVDEGCLLSFCRVPGGAVHIKAATDNRFMTISCPVETLISLESCGSAHLAGPDGLCAIERDRNSVLFRFISSDRRTRSFEIETARFDATVAMLAAGLSFASMN